MQACADHMKVFIQKKLIILNRFSWRNLEHFVVSQTWSRYQLKIVYSASHLAELLIEFTQIHFGSIYHIQRQWMLGISIVVRDSSVLSDAFCICLTFKLAPLLVSLAIIAQPKQVYPSERERKKTYTARMICILFVSQVSFFSRFSNKDSYSSSSLERTNDRRWKYPFACCRARIAKQRFSDNREKSENEKRTKKKTNK